MGRFFTMAVSSLLVWATLATVGGCAIPSGETTDAVGLRAETSLPVRRGTIIADGCELDPERAARVNTEGARVVVEVLQRPRGLQAFRVVSMDESTAVHPAQMPPPRTHVTVTATSGLERAQVKWFNRLRGFGFLTRGEGTEDIFVHMETLRRFGLTELRPGQYVLVRFGPGPKGLMAAEVRPEGVPHGQASH